MNLRRKVLVNSEIEEYAMYIGLDLEEDQDLLYIAREGLKAPLPPPWKPCQVKGKEIFYFNFETQESVWEHPCDKFYKEKARELKAAKAKRKSLDSKPARTPPSASKVSKANDLIPKPSSKPDKLSSELDAFRMDLEAEKQMVQERNANQLEEYKKDLKNQLADEEQSLRKAFEMEKEFKRAEGRKTIASQAAQQTESSRQAVRQRLDAYRDSLSQELERERKRAEEEERRSIQAFVEAETRKAQEEMRTQSRDIDARLERLQHELETLREQERTTAEAQRQKVTQSDSDVKNELERIQKAKDTLLRSEISKEQSRLESELAALQSATDLRIRELQRNMTTFVPTDDISGKEAKLRQDADRLLQSEMQALRARNQQKLLDFRREYDRKLEEDRLRIIQDQTRAFMGRLEDEKKAIDRDSRDSLLEYQRTLSQQLDADKRRLSEEWRTKLESLKPSEFLPSNTAEELELDGQIRLLTQDLAQWQEIARKKRAQLEQLRSAQDARAQDDARARRTQRPSTADSQDRVARMEREVQELKRLVLDSPEVAVARPSTAKPVRDPVHHWRMSLQQEKAEIREFQKVIEQEKKAWMNDCANYRDRPTTERKTELQAVKRVLDQQIAKLNDRVKELKLAENWIKKQDGGELVSFDDDLEEMKPDPLASEQDDDILSRWKHTPEPSPAVQMYPPVPLQPMATHKMQVYQRFLTREANKNDQIQSLFTRQNLWISNMKEELSKVHFSPSPRVPRTSYYY